MLFEETTWRKQGFFLRVRKTFTGEADVIRVFLWPSNIFHNKVIRGKWRKLNRISWRPLNIQNHNLAWNCSSAMIARKWKIKDNTGCKETIIEDVKVKGLSLFSLSFSAFERLQTYQITYNYSKSSWYVSHFPVNGKKHSTLTTKRRRGLCRLMVSMDLVHGRLSRRQK